MPVERCYCWVTWLPGYVLPATPPFTASTISPLRQARSVVALRLAIFCFSNPDQCFTLLWKRNNGENPPPSIASQPLCEHPVATAENRFFPFGFARSLPALMCGQKLGIPYNGRASPPLAVCKRALVRHFLFLIAFELRAQCYKPLVGIIDAVCFSCCRSVKPSLTKPFSCLACLYQGTL